MKRGNLSADRHWLHGLARWRFGAQALAVLVPGYCFSRLMRTGVEFDARCILSFDCDFPRDIAVLPSLVNLLGQYGYGASFACIGQWVRKYAEEHRCLVEAGHEIINHTETHPNLYHPAHDYAQGEGMTREYFNLIGRDDRRLEIERGHHTIADVLGVEPTGFRTPHFGNLHVDDVYGLLAELGYLYSSAVPVAGAGPLPFKTREGIWEIPLSPCPQHPFGVLDTWHSIGKNKPRHAGQGEMAALFARLLDATENGGLVNIYLDPYDAMQSGELLRMLEIMKDRAVVASSYGSLCDELQSDEKGPLPQSGQLQDFAE